jgi:hypothetical protein
MKSEHWPIENRACWRHFVGATGYAAPNSDRNNDDDKWFNHKTKFISYYNL